MITSIKKIKKIKIFSGEVFYPIKQTRVTRAGAFTPCSTYWNSLFAISPRRSLVSVGKSLRQRDPTRKKHRRKNGKKSASDKLGSAAIRRYSYCAGNSNKKKKKRKKEIIIIIINYLKTRTSAIITSKANLDSHRTNIEEKKMRRPEVNTRSEEFPFPAEHAERAFRYSDPAARLLVMRRL
ncbi:hypothetical protein PUN28_017244 [Cardiocondyla obscurior]|uniref:Uncharacterized protein n=1 Tax=Cardiocondyla obscurior TaxID=286306 RepID=A0AAW2ENP1_9HYME